ncbi:DUF4232 domain-containing protein [Actinophytocola gossypii]|uniref:DUF4232 domain-containing protein n=1 Tax=Actinophytocola gossypii TaxID=2812003 RepID=A0ABT2JGR3_9PSEU|nr:DUF4232 domain-containing protein [Actinophytocola gossypii]MCT2587077.1 DUF4232 domain-containing protein [Actinophytocola gossypii]
MRRVLWGVLVAAVLAGCTGQAPRALPPRAAAPSSEPPAAAECTADGVAFSLGGADAAMGVRVLNVEIVNCGAEPVTVDGYPSLRLFDGEQEDPLAVRVTHGSSAVATVPALDVPPTPVTLAPGESAWAGLVWRNLVTDATVPATTAVALDVALSQGTDWHQVPLHPTTIDLGNTDTIGLGPWQRLDQERTDRPGEAPNPTAPPSNDPRDRT